MTNFKTLKSITKQDSGIVMHDGTHLLVVNWAKVCKNGGMPVMSPAETVIEWIPDAPLKVLTSYRTENIKEAILSNIKAGRGWHDAFTEFDEKGEIGALWGCDFEKGAIIKRDAKGNVLPTAGTVFKIGFDDSTVLVIAPDGCE